MTNKKTINIEEHIPEFIAWLNKKVSYSSRNVLNKDLLAKIQTKTELGFSEADIYTQIRVPKSTWFFWKKQAKDLISDLYNGEKEFENLTEYGISLLVFMVSLTRARETRLIHHLEIIDKASEGNLPNISPDWRASAWILEREFPERFGRNRNTNEINKREREQEEFHKILFMLEDRGFEFD